MIIDTLDNLNFYFGLSAGLDCALSVLKHYNLENIEPGEYKDFPIDGCDTVLKIFKPELVCDDDEIPWEYHEQHIDVQCVLSGGNELIGYAPRGKLAGWEYDPEEDVAYTRFPCDYLPIRLKEGEFAVFFPQDAHRKIRSGGNAGYRKLVFKVPAKGFKVNL